VKKFLLLILCFLSLSVFAQDMDTALYNSIERYHAQKNARFNGYYKGIDVSKYQHEIEWSSLDTTLNL
jgi:GH25 family lysozyme M1 (1,4-beta-N-acetylmuramidase)